MAYRWSLEGPAFEYPSPFGTENRFLELRGYGLIAFALAVTLVLAFVSEDIANRPVVQIEKLPQPASVWPHAIGAMLMALLGVLNLMQASRQRTLLLTPGQPASLMPEVAHEATGASSGAAWLTKALERGQAMPPEIGGSYASWLQRLGPHLPAAPATLHDYLRVRLSRLALFGGLVGLLALGALASLLMAKPAALPMVALVVFLVATAALARHLLYPAQAAPSPVAIVAMLVAGLVAAVPLAWFSNTLPGAGHWPRLGLPAAASVVLTLGLLFEMLGLLAARAQLVAPRGTAVEGDTVTVGFAADPGRLMAEIDRELQRRWADGVPNRRYARLPPAVDPSAEEGGFNATVLEESQPRAVAAARGAAAPRPGPRWLLGLELLGLCASGAGGLLWLWLARAHMLDATASWVPAAIGLACLLAGGHALRIGHLLWSRVEVDSTVIWLDFAGAYFRLPEAAAATAPAPPGRNPAWQPVGVEGMTAKACVARLRSVFYGAAEHGAGSRVLLSIADDPAAARGWTAVVQAFARSAGADADSPTLRVARAKARERRPAAPEPPTAVRRPVRFCSACGTHLLAGARFCQHCGNPVSTD